MRESPCERGMNGVIAGCGIAYRTRRWRAISFPRRITERVPPQEASSVQKGRPMSSRIFAGFAAALLLVLPFTAPKPARADDDVGAKVYAEALKSVVWIHSPRGE